MDLERGWGEFDCEWELRQDPTEEDEARRERTRVDTRRVSREGASSSSLQIKSPSISNKKQERRQARQLGTPNRKEQGRQSSLSSSRKSPNYTRHSTRRSQRIFYPPRHKSTSPTVSILVLLFHPSPLPTARGSVQNVGPPREPDSNQKRMGRHQPITPPKPSREPNPTLEQSAITMPDPPLWCVPRILGML